MCYYGCLIFSPFDLPPPNSHSHSKFPHCCPCPWNIHTCSFTTPFPFFPPVPLRCFLLAAVSLLPVSMTLVLFCSLVYFVQYWFFKNTLFIFREGKGGRKRGEKHQWVRLHPDNPGTCPGIESATFRPQCSVHWTTLARADLCPSMGTVANSFTICSGLAQNRSIGRH